MTLLIVALSAPAFGQARSLETCNAGEPTTTQGLPDADSDTVADAIDNCLNVANSSQRDTDGDGIGNSCDADLDNNGVVNAADLGLLKGVFFSSEAGLHADLDGDGTVSLSDLVILRESFFKAPGPVGPCLLDTDLCAGSADFEFDDIGANGEGNLFVFRSTDPATIYHARRLLSGATQCNPRLAGSTFLGTQPWNPNWGFYMGGTISFHGNTINTQVGCNQRAHMIEADLGSWCDIDTRSSACRFWCPWQSQLTREMP
jgi:hypothetical protein